jgi:hypothetical protein
MLPIQLGHKARYHFSESAEIERRELLLSMFGGLTGPKAVCVGSISFELSNKIRAHTVAVFITPITMMKVKGKHGDILCGDLELLQHVFNVGRVYQDGARHLIFLFRDPRKHSRTLKAVVKSSKRGEELILSSYHLCTGRRLKAALKKTPVLRHGGPW